MLFILVTRPSLRGMFAPTLFVAFVEPTAQCKLAQK
jgi:hypothetical protein